MNIPGTAANILQAKPTQTVHTTRPEAWVYDAIKCMGELSIGALVVVDDQSKVVGVLSERDYSRKVVLAGRTSRETRVHEILSQPVITVTPDESVSRCMELMSTHRIRHLPVLDGGNLVGLISIGDLVNWVITFQRETISQLHGYISGQYPA